jgi:hypothetical protein
MSNEFVKPLEKIVKNKCFLRFYEKSAHRKVEEGDHT